MAVFHRLTVPSYFGGLPSGYDYVNNAVSGTPAGANGQLVAGPNVGSYFVGFADDGTSADANRPAQALATNTDYLDDLMRADLAKVVVTANVTPGSPVPSVTLTGPGVFLGISGGTPLTELFQVTDGNDNDITLSGAKIVVASITGGAVGSGFSAGSVTITFNLSIPSGQTYRVYYGFRTNLATLPADILFEGRLGRGDVADFQDFVKQISRPGTMPGTVTGIVGTLFETPDGTRLAQSNAMTMSVDPNDSGAPARLFTVETRANTGSAETLFTLLDDPTSTLFTGVTSLAILHAPSGMGAFGVDAATGSFYDNNIAGAAPANFIQVIPWSSPMGTNGDQYIRTFDALPISGSPGTAPESILQRLNAVWTCTVGDGVSTFGDFNGVNGLDDALAFALAAAVFSVRIQVKDGSYTINTGRTFHGINVTIEGVGSDTNVQWAGAGTPALTVDSGGVLTARNFVMGNISGSASYGLIAQGGGNLVLDRMFFIDLQVTVDSPGVMNSDQAFYASDSSWEMATAGSKALILSVGDGTSHDGYVLERCNWTCVDDTTPVFLAGTSVSGISGGTLSGILFRDCTYTLGGTTTTASCLTHNTGILEILPGASGSLNFILPDITWERCKGLVVTSLNNGVIATIMPVSVQATTVTNYANIGVVTMEDCNWKAGAFATDISPFFIAAQKIVMRDTNCFGTGHFHNAQSPDMAVALQTTAVADADWGQFTIAVAPAFYVTTPGDVGIVLDNVSFNHFLQNCDACDVRLEMPVNTADAAAHTSLKNVRLQGYLAGGAGAAPNYRINLFQLPSFVAADGNATIEGLVLRGHVGSGSFAWATNGLVGIQPSTGVELIRCRADNFSQASGPQLETGFFVNYLASAELFDITLRDCSSDGMGWGVRVPAAGGGANPFDGFQVIGGHYNGHVNNGIGVFVDFPGYLRIDAVRTDNNTLEGIKIQVNNASPTVTQHLHVHDNRCQGNDGAAGNPAEIYINTVSGTFPVMSLFGNRAKNASGGTGFVRIAASNGTVALTTPGQYPLLGVETAINAFGATDGTQLVSMDDTMFNQARLLSPGP